MVTGKKEKQGFCTVWHGPRVFHPTHWHPGGNQAACEISSWKARFPRNPRNYHLCQNPLKASKVGVNTGWLEVTFWVREWERRLFGSPGLVGLLLGRKGQMARKWPVWPQYRHSPTLTHQRHSKEERQAWPSCIGSSPGGVEAAGLGAAQCAEGKSGLVHTRGGEEK